VSHFDTNVEHNTDTFVEDEIGEAPDRQPQRLGRGAFGFATVERHPTGGAVIRWAGVTEAGEEPTVDEVLKSKRVFEVGEWLGKIPISDGLRQEFFNLEWVKVRVCVYILVTLN
jgi:hypothetical protein